MKQKSCIILVLALVFLTGGALAQSGRNTGTPGGKTNQRTAQPTPSPNPAPTPNNTTAVVTPAADDSDVIKIDTQLVSVPVRVMDKSGRFISGMTKENFSVFENGVQQQVEMFSNEHEPFTVALVLDMSYSTTFKIADIQSAAVAFIDQLRPQDKVMVISFDEEVHVLCEATNDRNAIYRAIRSTKIGTGTSLYEAVDLVMNNRMRAIQGRKAIILFTDGVDTTSRRADDYSNLSDAMELDSLIYTIRYDTFNDVQSMKNSSVISVPIPNSGGVTIPVSVPGVSTAPANTRGTTAEEYQRAEEYLNNLAYRTGGRTYLAGTLGNLSGAFSKIASELREFYSLGYYPTVERVVGKATNIKVRVDQPGAVVRAREGYVVPKKTKINGH